MVNRLFGKKDFDWFLQNWKIVQQIVAYKKLLADLNFLIKIWDMWLVLF